jgi:CheY-like chemotaxis protein
MTNKDTTGAVQQKFSMHRILIVDDEKAVRDVFLRVVSSRPGCRVDVAVNGAEAVEFFRCVRHAAIVMDLKMPGMNGEEAFGQIQRICDEEKWTMPSVVFCTGFSPTEKIRNIVAKDPRHCLLMKPIAGSQLVQALDSVLARAGA